MIKDCIIFQTSYLFADDVYELSKEELDIINSEKTLMQGVKKFVNKPVVISKPGRYISIIYDKTIGLFYYTSENNQRTYIIPDTSYVYKVVKPFVAKYDLDILDHIAKVILDGENYK